MTHPSPPTAPPSTKAHRRRLVQLVALVLALAGVVLITVAACSSKSGPPQPSAAAAGNIDNPSIPSVAASTSVSASAGTAPSSAVLPNTAPTTSATKPSSAATSSRPAATKPSTSKAAPTPSTTKPSTPTTVVHPQPQTQGLILKSSPPVSLSIPSLDVTSALLDLGLNSDGTVQVPDLNDPDSKAGWYKYSPSPGALGPSIILGHIDSKKYGPGVFYNLGKLNPGDTVDVTRADHTVAVFRIDGVRSYPKNNFPTLEVYGNLDHAGLRLITCGGTFDPSIGSYESNIVAFATLVSSHPA